MRNAVLVVLVVLLAAMVAAPVSAEFVNDRSCDPYYSGEHGNKRGYDAGYNCGGNDYGYRQGSYNRSNDYGRSSGYDQDNRNRTSFNVGVGARIGGVGVNLGYSKTTYSKPKTSSQKPPVVIVNNPPVVVVNPTSSVTNKCQMSLVREVGDKLETISPIVVTNPEKTLVAGTHIVFERNGGFLADYEVVRISGDTVFVKVVDAPRGKPRQGDGFTIDPELEPINTAD